MDLHRDSTDCVHRTSSSGQPDIQEVILDLLLTEEDCGSFTVKAVTPLSSSQGLYRVEVLLEDNTLWSFIIDVGRRRVMYRLRDQLKS